MQVFILDNDMQTSARYYTNKHVVKQPVEIAQILCTCLHIKGINDERLYKPTHPHHPWVKWCCEDWNNFGWLLVFYHFLSREYSFRYNKQHATNKIANLCWTVSYFPMPTISQHTPFPLCMPDQYKVDDVVQSYRNYYIGEKSHLFQWKNRPKPEWIP